MSIILAHGLSPPLIEVMMAVVLEGAHSVLPNSNQYILWFPPPPPTNQKPLSTLPGKSKRHRTRLTKAAAEMREIRVCTNRTCRKQGSFQTLEVVTDLAPPDITVKSSGCLGRCGSGPNVVTFASRNNSESLRYSC
ncbi:hypothetical protein OIU77_008288 [Salix suchowensis]|uniref:(2Fe-2S) ferredoxin domain-containing protein n=1 Tax=Salix suchowensis TaxID=1278906 RepID=A0ABQ9AIX8_9ROSI|nr:hypothetical protein OIU77_008288 [Salix suchowensis]